MLFEPIIILNLDGYHMVFETQNDEWIFLESFIEILEVSNLPFTLEQTVVWYNPNNLEDFLLGA